ncbi:ABC transporter ATP-binding protein [Allofournierella massiliensis]|uniref:Nickel import system ATP-binding protein NikD n=1 Tax=Allofournierella massiliensis TaxID=1650663 RepID=A0A4R1R7L4_9FIRM|nr:ABC transporter ATP-binding protein [Fournierella massiliensis]TCL61312.1 peptide/nickel transport system ATP-binding protein [Fournierella massiliensis]
MEENRQKAPLLQVQGLTVSFSRYAKGFRRVTLPGVRDLSFSLDEGELVAVVGASGSGKSLLAHRLLGILPHNAQVGGQVLYRDQPLDDRLAGKLRGHEIVLVPQNVSYLDPLMQVGEQVKGEKGDAQKASAALRRYGLGSEVEKMYPFQLSGGMARRVLIATAVQHTPKLVVADEPTPGLHPEAARRVLGHFKELAQAGAGVLLITHDLEAALEVADRVIVLYAGAAVEEAPAASFAAKELLQHPYTQALWQASPNHGFVPLPGTQPVGQLPAGCAFAPRCPKAGPECHEGAVAYEKRGAGYVRCLHPEGEQL